MANGRVEVPGAVVPPDPNYVPPTISTTLRVVLGLSGSPWQTMGGPAFRPAAPAAPSPAPAPYLPYVAPSSAASPQPPAPASSGQPARPPGVPDFATLKDGYWTWGAGRAVTRVKAPEAAPLTADQKLAATKPPDALAQEAAARKAAMAAAALRRKKASTAGPAKLPAISPSQRTVQAYIAPTMLVGGPA